jgi:nitrogen-specific signal transduction histidine kinase
VSADPVLELVLVGGRASEPENANLPSNAVQAADYDHARGRSFLPDLEIVFSVNRSDSDLVLGCEDNGPSLPDKPEGWIWEPFNSTKPNGSGMGLYIVSDGVT